MSKQITQKFIHISLLIFLILIYTHSSLSFNGASRGLYVWYTALVPVLLPVMIILRLLYAYSSKKNVWLLIILSSIAGIPTSSKTTTDLYKEGYMDERKYRFLILLTANPSLSFLTSYIVLIINKKHSISGFMLIFPIIIVFLSSFIIATLHTILNTHNDYIHITHIKCNNEHTLVTKTNFDDIILSCVITMLKILGFIILFSTISELLSMFGDSLFVVLIRSSLEISCGVLILLENTNNAILFYCLINTLCSFGGMCGIFQILSILPKDSNISLFFLLKYKMLNAIIAFSISYLTMLLF